MITDILITMLSSLIGVRVSLITQLLKKADLLNQDKENAELLTDKIEELTVSLRKSSKLMSEIEIEFAKQKELANKWKEEATTSQIIASLNENEVAAVSKIFGGQLEKENKKSGRWSLFWNIVFCLIGLIGGYFISKFLL